MCFFRDTDHTYPADTNILGWGISMSAHTFALLRKVLGDRRTHGLSCKTWSLLQLLNVNNLKGPCSATSWCLILSLYLKDTENLWKILSFLWAWRIYAESLNNYDGIQQFSSIIEPAILIFWAEQASPVCRVRWQQTHWASHWESKVSYRPAHIHSYWGNYVKTSSVPSSTCLGQQSKRFNIHKTIMTSRYVDNNWTCKLSIRLDWRLALLLHSTFWGILFSQSTQSAFLMCLSSSACIHKRV